MNNIIFIFIIIFNVGCLPKHQLIAIDNFESDSLSEIWNTDKFVEGSLKTQSEYARKGQKSACLTLKSGDQITKEKGSNYERAELKEIKKNISYEEENIEYSFSLLLPKDFPISSTRLVIAQWKQNCKFDNCTPDNPILALRFNSGKLYITKQSSVRRDTLFLQNNLQLGKWLDFTFKVRFSSQKNGRIIATLNKEKIIDFLGETAYPENNGEYKSPNNFYFKMGLYRDKSPETMTIYIDNYQKRVISKL